MALITTTADYSSQSRVLSSVRYGLLIMLIGGILFCGYILGVNNRVTLHELPFTSETSNRPRVSSLQLHYALRANPRDIYISRCVSVHGHRHTLDIGI